MTLDVKQIDKVVLNALEEDMPYGDVTTDNLIPDGDFTEAKLIAKADGVIAGIPVAARVFELIDSRTSLDVLKNDGERVQKGDIIAILRGPTAAVLKGERTALNLLQRMVRHCDAYTRFCRSCEGLPRKRCGHTENDARPALSGEICRTLRRRQKPSLFAVRCGHAQR